MEKYLKLIAGWWIVRALIYIGTSLQEALDTSCWSAVDTHLQG